MERGPVDFLAPILVKQFSQNAQFRGKQSGVFEEVSVPMGLTALVESTAAPFLKRLSVVSQLFRKCSNRTLWKSSSAEKPPERNAKKDCTNAFTTFCR